MSHNATLRLVDGVVVVEQADDEIWIHDHVIDEVRERGTHHEGELELDGELIRFGTPGRGLGQLTYRLVGHDDRNGWHIARREGA